LFEEGSDLTLSMKTKETLTMLTARGKKSVSPNQRDDEVRKQ